MNYRLLHLFFVLSFMVGVISCRKGEVIYVDERGVELKEYDYYIDEYGNEGIVISSNNRGVIIVLSLDETESSWGPLSSTIFPIYDTIVLDKNKYSISMLYAMEREGIAFFPAQAWCFYKNHGKKSSLSSWHLPSYHDWAKEIIVYKNWDDRLERIQELNAAIKRYGGVPLKNDEYYWTCTEDHEGYFDFKDSTLYYDYDAANRAIMISPLLYTSVTKDLWSKRNVYKVRALKYVYYKD